MGGQKGASRLQETPPVGLCVAGSQGFAPGPEDEAEGGPWVGSAAVSWGPQPYPRGPASPCRGAEGRFAVTARERRLGAGKGRTTSN